MVITRPQVSSKNQSERTNMEEFSDEDSDVSLSELQSKSFYVENNTETTSYHERDHENIRIEQRFNEVNRQIGGITSMVKALTEKMTNSREENDQNVLIS